MDKNRSFWDRVTDKLFPKTKELEESTEKIKRSTWNLKKIKHNDNLSIEDKISRVNNNKENTIDEIKSISNIKDSDIDKNVDFDYDFLKDSLEEWSKHDVAFVVLLVGINLLYMKNSNINEKGKKKHEDHSYKANKKEGFKKNTIHKGMPNDKIPDSHMGLKNPNGGRAGGSAKINGVNLNHRQIYGHDLLKPFEIFAELNKIEDVTPILGSTKLGAIIKQLFHMFYDLHSETGLPLPGSTYFLDFLTKNFINSSDDYIKYFSLHIEDIYSALGIEGCLYLYNRKVRGYINGENIDYKLDWSSFKNLTSIEIKDRTFREYEMGIITHSLIIWLQLNISTNFRSKINHVSIVYLLKNLGQFIRLNTKWNKEYKNLLIKQIQEIQQFEIPEELKERYQNICKECDIEYDDNFYILMNNFAEAN